MLSLGGPTFIKKQKKNIINSDMAPSQLTPIRQIKKTSLSSLHLYKAEQF